MQGGQGAGGRGSPEQGAGGRGSLIQGRQPLRRPTACLCRAVALCVNYLVVISQCFPSLPEDLCIMMSSLISKMTPRTLKKQRDLKTVFHVG